MDSDKKNKVGSRQLSAFKQIERMHPIRMLLYLSMVGIGVLFFILLVAFIRTGGFQGENVQLPKFFSISTVLLLFSSYTISRIPGIYRKDKLHKMTRYLGATLVLGLNFILDEQTCNPAPEPVLTMEFKVRVPLLSDFIPANIFTPNGDGKNDFFEIPDLPSDFCSAQFTGIKVVNRWGTEVYSSNQNNFKWDGKGVNDGVYFYVIDFGSTQYKGSVTIVR